MRFIKKKKEKMKKKEKKRIINKALTKFSKSFKII